MELVLYHGTDEKHSDSIIAKGFIAKKNPRHWLGNGIYFFIDKALAEWWTTRPTHKFGHDIASPIIFQCSFSAPEESVLDLRKFIDFTYCCDRFSIFYNSIRLHGTMDEIDFSILRCAFFDWLFDTQKYSAIIGTFSSARQPYFQSILQPDSCFEQLNLAYNEVQVCIPESRQQYIGNLMLVQGFVASTT